MNPQKEVNTATKKRLVKTYEKAKGLFTEKTGMQFPPQLPTDIDIFKTKSKRFRFFVGTKAEWVDFK